MTTKKLAKDIYEAVGGSSNINSVMHCMTRLRLRLKNEGLVNDEAVKALDGVLGVAHSNGQYQIIIGPSVAKVFEEFTLFGDFEKTPQIEENLDGTEKWSLKKVGKSVLNYMSNCMTPLIPVLITAGLFKALNSVLGPGVLNLYSEKDDLFLFLNLVFDAGFYFMPIYVGINAAKQLKVEPMLGGMLGGFLIVPEFVNMVTDGTKFTPLGINVSLVNYGQTVIPIMVSVYVMSIIFKFFKKVMPDSITTLATPFLTMLLTIPISILFLAPLGTNIGALISSSLLLIGEKTGFLGIAIVAVLWPFLVMTGMHLALMMPMMANFFETGVAQGILLSGAYAIWAIYGVALGAFFRLKNKEKSAAFGYFISGIVGGISEPTLYGISLKYRKNLITMMIGAAVGAAYAGIMGVQAYVMTAANFLYFLSFVGGTSINIIHGTISVILSFVVAALLSYFFGFSKEELKPVK